MIGDNRKERFCKSIGKLHSICTEQVCHTHKKQPRAKMSSAVCNLILFRSSAAFLVFLSASAGAGIVSARFFRLLEKVVCKVVLA